MTRYRLQLLPRAIMAACLSVALVVGSFGGVPQTTNALAGSDFKADRIMDNGVFFYSGDFSAQSIQNFLNAKVPSCDTNGTQPYSGTTAAAYGSARGYPPPYTCLKNYRQDTTAKPAEAGLCNGYGASNQSAAEIIYGVSQSCGINPRALIVLLQKEQGLVTDTWPWSSQYAKATGYGCPDTASCNTQYAGFFNQVYNAARQFKNYAKSPLNYNYVSGRNNAIRFSPTASCGSSNIMIQNQATAGLYNYTPYQPNNAALNNLYGTGDSCSSYGNRNFWRTYQDWFGSTLGDASTAQWSFEHLDGTPQSVTTSSGNVGNYPFTITVGTATHVFYYDIDGGNLKHGWTGPSGWSFETVDGEGGTNGRINADVGGYTKAIEMDGKIIVAYRDFQNNALRVATFASGAWSAETIDGDGGTNGRTTNDVGWDIRLFEYGNALHAFYSDASGGNLRHAFYAGGQWYFEDLDGAPSAISRRNGNMGQGISGVVVNNDLHLFYLNGSEGNLRHGWHDATGWHFEDLDGGSNTFSRFSSNLGFSSEVVWWHGSFQLFYRDAQRHLVRHAWTSPSGWRFEDLDGTYESLARNYADLGWRIVLVPTGTNRLNVFYYDATNRAIRQAWFDINAGWRFTNIDGTLNSISGKSAVIGEHFSSAVMGSELQLYYFDATNQALKHAFGPLL